MTQLKVIGDPAKVQTVLKTNRPILKDQMIVCGDVSMMTTLAQKHPDLFKLVGDSAQAPVQATAQAEPEAPAQAEASEPVPSEQVSEVQKPKANKKLKKTQVSKLATK